MSGVLVPCGSAPKPTRARRKPKRDRVATPSVSLGMTFVMVLRLLWPHLHPFCLFVHASLVCSSRSSRPVVSAWFVCGASGLAQRNACKSVPAGLGASAFGFFLADAEVCADLGLGFGGMGPRTAMLTQCDSTRHLLSEVKTIAWSPPPRVEVSPFDEGQRTQRLFASHMRQLVIKTRCSVLSSCDAASRSGVGR